MLPKSNCDSFTYRAGIKEGNESTSDFPPQPSPAWQSRRWDPAKEHHAHLLLKKKNKLKSVPFGVSPPACRFHSITQRAAELPVSHCSPPRTPRPLLSRCGHGLRGRAAPPCGRSAALPAPPRGERRIGAPRAFGGGRGTPRGFWVLGTAKAAPQHFAAVQQVGCGCVSSLAHGRPSTHCQESRAE